MYAIGKVGDDVKLLLDPERLLNDEDLSSLDNKLELDEDDEEGDE